VTGAGEDLPDLLSQISLIGFLMDFVCKSMDVWVNTSVVRRERQLDALRSIILELMVGLMFYWF